MRNAAGTVVCLALAAALGGCVFDTSDGGANSAAYEARAYSTKTGLNAERPVLPRPYEPASGTFENGAWLVGDVFVAGQPDEAALRDLIENEGVTLVVNLRTPREMERMRADAERPFDEAAFVRPYTVSHDVEYVDLPIGGEENPPTPSQVDAFAEALARHEHRALVKCSVGSRASQMWAAYLVRRWGCDVNEAVRQAEMMAMTPTTMERLLGEEFEYRVKNSGK